MTLVCVLDAASLRFVRSHDRATLTVLAGTGEKLAECHVRGTDEREHALEAMDAVLASAKLLRADPADPDVRARVPVVLYNPYTAQVSAGPLPETVAYTDSEPLELPVAGAVGRLDDDELVVGLRTLPRHCATRGGLVSAHAAHSI